MKITLNNKNDLQKYLNYDSIYDQIYLEEGSYNQKITIYKDNIEIIGIGNVIISNNDHYYKIHKDNKEYNTFRTYTVKVLADNVVLRNITIENTSTPSSIYGQAVALHVCGTNFKCIDSTLKGAQDTLFTGPLPKNLHIRYKDFLPDNELTPKQSKQQYINTTIYGDVDFIFGGAMAYFYKCNINCIGDKGYICAPSHYEEQKYGYLFNECTINILNKYNKCFYLGRPWRDYGMAYFINNTHPYEIYDEVFNDWVFERRNTCRFAIYNENIDTSKIVPFAKILTKNEADNFILEYLKELNK